MRQRRHIRAFSLIEAMAILVILSIVGVGMGIGLQSASRVPAANERIIAISTELCSEADYWRDLAYGASPWPATLPYSLTDTVSINVRGQTLSLSRTVSIQNWDPNNLSGNASPKSDFARVQITVDGQSVAFYVTKPT